MAVQRSIFSCIIIFLALASCYNSLDDDLIHNYHTQEEFGYFPQAYPSYISRLDGSEAGTYGLKRVSRLEDSATTMNIDSFGAVGDGTHDDTQAFLEAWKEACSSSVAVIFVVPQGKNYLVMPIRFSGPCKSEIIMQIFGTIVASDKMSDYSKDGRHWIVFDRVNNLIVEGGGTINGNGDSWWQNSCKINKTLPCKGAPTALTFYKCQNLVVENLKSQNAQQIHISFEGCLQVHASNLVVTAPGDSPNTDGIHITATQNIHISSCTIGTGDDCISIVSGSQRVLATNITCGPGHGISIGSLGGGKSEAEVSGITVNGAKLIGTTNGVRIKTWQGGSGTASKIKFENVDMHDVKNPIIIDQNYCDQPTACEEQQSAVQVKDVVYQNIKGTSATEFAVNFNCSKSFPCQRIILQNVELVGEGGDAAKAACNNVNFYNVGSVSPRCP